MRPEAHQRNVLYIVCSTKHVPGATPQDKKVFFGYAGLANIFAFHICSSADRGTMGMTLMAS